MTAQEIVDHFVIERRTFRTMRATADGGNVDPRYYVWDDIRAHISAFLDRVDPKRQTITDWQLADTIPLGEPR